MESIIWPMDLRLKESFESPGMRFSVNWEIREVYA